VKNKNKHYTGELNFYYQLNEQLQVQ